MLNRKKKLHNKKKRRSILLELLVVLVFVLSMAFYVTSKLKIHSMNITLQKEAQQLQATVSAKQEEVSQLETEINALQNKTRLLGMLDNSVKDNQNNIYIIDVQ